MVDLSGYNKDQYGPQSLKYLHSGSFQKRSYQPMLNQSMLGVLLRSESCMTQILRRKHG